MSTSQHQKLTTPVGVVRYEVGRNEVATRYLVHQIDTIPVCYIRHDYSLFIQENNTRLPPVTAHNTVLEYYYSGQSTA
jgi:hypothetical protein